MPSCLTFSTQRHPLQEPHLTSCISTKASLCSLFLQRSRPLDGPALISFLKPSPAGAPSEPLVLTPPFTHTCRDRHHLLSSPLEMSPLPSGHPPTAAAPLPCQMKSLLHHPLVFLKESKCRGRPMQLQLTLGTRRTARLHSFLRSASTQQPPPHPPSPQPPLNQPVLLLPPGPTSAPGQPWG